MGLRIDYRRLDGNAEEVVRVLGRLVACQTPDRSCKCAPNDDDIEAARRLLAEICPEWSLHWASLFVE